MPRRSARLTASEGTIQVTSDEGSVRSDTVQKTTSWKVQTASAPRDDGYDSEEIVIAVQPRKDAPKSSSGQDEQAENEIAEKSTGEAGDAAFTRDALDSVVSGQSTIEGDELSSNARGDLDMPDSSDDEFLLVSATSHGRNSQMDSSEQGPSHAECGGSVEPTRFSPSYTSPSYMKGVAMVRSKDGTFLPPKERKRAFLTKSASIARRKLVFD